MSDNSDNTGSPHKALLGLVGFGISLIFSLIVLSQFPKNPDRPPEGLIGAPLQTPEDRAEREKMEQLHAQAVARFRQRIVSLRDGDATTRKAAVETLRDEKDSRALGAAAEAEVALLREVRCGSDTAARGVAE
jgi:hypothetical protein